MGNSFKFQPFSKKQMKVLTWWNEKSPVNRCDGIICDGAIRSGKTVCMSLSFVIWAMESFSGCNFALCGKTIGSLRRNVVRMLKVMLVSRGYIVSEHRGDNVITVRSYKAENYFYMFGGKDESSQDLIQGITLAGVLLDEVALMPESFVNQATARCSVTGSKFWFNCNPDGPYHFFKREWIDKLDCKNLLYLHFDMDDNLSLSDEVKQRYKTQWTGVFYRRYIKGEWAIAEGVIYDMFDASKHVIDEFPEMLTDATYISVDYGTLNPTVFLMWQKSVDGRWICVKEYYYDGRKRGKQKTDEEYADDLIKFTDNKNIKSVIVDPSAASFIACIKKRKFIVKKAKNEVLDGIRFTCSLLKNNRIAFISECENTQKEFNSYVWDEKAAKCGEDKPMKEHDHAMDAVRYFCNTIINRKQWLL